MTNRKSYDSSQNKRYFTLPANNEKSHQLFMLGQLVGWRVSLMQYPHLDCSAAIRVQIDVMD